MCNYFWKLSISLGLTLCIASVHATSGPVGSVDGSFSVTSNGAASYVIPIKVPVGIAGIKPAISLAYSSQTRNGLLGVGWRLSGFSTMTRCSQNLAQDGQIRNVKLDAGDQFCLDGQRLVVVAGSYGKNNAEYRTEQDSFVKIISKGFRDNGPESFEVLTKDGLRMQFGDVTANVNGQFNSRFAPHGKEVVHIWAISRITDNAGNVINFNYQFVGDKNLTTSTASTIGYNREYYPNEITYSGGGKIGFSYSIAGSETRPDPIIGYQNGGKVQTLKRLVKIRVGVESTLAREYVLAYKPVDDSNQSRLSTVTECGADPQQCLPATKIAWSSDQNSSQSTAWLNADNAALPAGVLLTDGDDKFRGVRFIDLDGDGVKDVVYYRWINANTAAEVGAYLYKNNTWVSSPSFHPPYPLARDDKTHPGAEIIDINGDGLVDFIYARQETDSKFSAVSYLNNGSAWVKDRSGKFKLTYPLGRFDNWGRVAYFADLNGDGMVDFVYKNRNQLQTCKIKYGGLFRSNKRTCGSVATTIGDQGAYFGSSTGWSENQASHIPPVALDDWPLFEVIDRYPGENNNQRYRSLSPTPRRTVQFIDVNGDGLNDLLFYDNNTNGVYLKTYSGWETSLATNYQFPVNLGTDDYGEAGVRFADVNGDGLVDIVQHRHIEHTPLLLSSSGGLLAKALAKLNAKSMAKAAAASHQRAYLNTGDGWIQNEAYIPPQPIALKIGENIQYVDTIFQDVNSDGLVDILSQRSGGSREAYLNTGTDWQQNNKYSSPYDMVQNGKNTGTLVIDLDDNAKLDIVSTEGIVTSNIERHLVNGITTGLGVSTYINYKPLTDPTVYRKGQVGCQYPISCVSAPSLVVSEHKVSNGIGGIAEYLHKYTDARIHSLGRGWLGFASRTIIDMQTQQATTTSYDNVTYNEKYNAFPFIRLPKKITISYPDGILGKKAVISESNNDYRVKSVAEHSPYYSVYLQSSTSETIDIDGLPLKYVSTTSEMDDYGNTVSIIIDTQESPQDVAVAYRQTTANAYINDTTNWHLGRLTSASVTSYEGENSQTRSTAYGYYPSGHPNAGMLQWAEDEPSNPDLYLKTSYTYDAYGNQNSVSINGSASATHQVPTRMTSNYFDYGNNLRPKVTTTVPVEGAITQSETKVYDALWGKLVSQTGPNGLSSSWTYDAFGRRNSETLPDGSTTHWTYDWCDGNTACPTHAVYQVTTSRSDGAQTTVYMDKFSRQLGGGTSGLDGVVMYYDVEYDAVGRPWRNSRPYFADATSKYWTTTTFDKLSRVKSRINPDGSVVRTDYKGRQTTISTERSTGGEFTNLSVRQVMNLADQIEWIFDAHNNRSRYTYLPFGELETVTDPLGNVVIMEYDNRGRKTKMIDPDMGTWDYSSDALGNLRWQQDAKGQETTMDYDLLNRLRKREDVRGQTSSSSVERISRWEYFTSTDAANNCRSIGKLKSSSDGSITKKFCYDHLGRSSLITANFDGTSYSTSTEYDEFSRVKAVTYPTQDAGNQSAFTIHNVYDGYGNLKAVQDGASNDALWTAEQIDASGNITSETLGNGLTTHRTYDDAMGYIKSISTGVGSSSGVQNLAFEFDSLGTLVSRTDRNRIITHGNGTTQNSSIESFTYDALNRVSTVLRDGRQTTQYQYDALGNITFNSELGTYLYSSTRPHAVTEIKRSNTGTLAGDISGDGRINGLDVALLARNLVGLSALNNFQMMAADCNSANGVNLDDSVCLAAHAGSTSSTVDERLSYDANGNMLQGIGGKVVTYTAFNKPETVTRGEYSSRFSYDTENSRYLQVAINSNGTTTTHYFGQLFERIQKSNGIIEYKNYVYAGGRMVALSTRRSDNSTDLNYLHQDHITSITAITDANGIIKARFSYDVFGKRRNDASWKAASFEESIVDSATTSDITHHGYTEHEFLEGLALIHMNGRVYDPELGRFLSPDPFIQFPHNSQSFNRYSYVMNNPLSFNDPSGYLLGISCGVCSDVVGGIKDFRDDISKAYRDFREDIKNFVDDNWRTIAAIAITAIPGVNVAAAGFLSSLIASGGDLRAAMIGGMTAGMFAGLHSFQPTTLWSGVGKVMAHGAVGGVSSVMNGGEFKAGFMSAAVTQSVSQVVGDKVFGANLRDPKVRLTNAFAAGAIGGTTSVLTGGKFKNGAMTGAFSRMFNDLCTTCSSAENEPEPSWVNRVKKFFGFTGDAISSAAQNRLGPIANGAVGALKVDSLSGVGAIVLRKRMNICEGTGNCTLDDTIAFRRYMSEKPPNFQAIDDLLTQNQ